MKKLDKRIIIIISCVFLCMLAIISFIVIQNKKALSSNNRNNENNPNLGDFVCSNWEVLQDWSAWTSTYIDGHTSEPSNNDTSNTTYYTQVQVNSSNPGLCGSLPCYRKKVWGRSCQDNCSLTITNVSGYKHMSLSESVSIKFTINGTNCGQYIGATLGNFNGPTAGLFSDSTYSYTPTNTCTSGTISGYIVDKGITSDTVSIDLLPNWQGGYTQSFSGNDIYGEPTSAPAANVAGKDYYFENCTLKEGSTNVYNCKYWYRGCGSTPPGPGPVTTTYCWKKLGSNGTENDYVESDSSPGTGYTNIGEVGTVTCSETPACYNNNNTYVTGKYAGQTGYTKVSDDTTKCNKLEIRKVNENNNDLAGSTFKFYKVFNNTRIEIPLSNSSQYTTGGYSAKLLEDGSYILKETAAPAGYQLLSDEISITVSNGSITINGNYPKTNGKNAKITIANTPTVISYCWINSSTNDYRWATTSPGAGYTKSTTITSESACVASNVCFKNSAGTEYKWQSAYPGSGWTIVTGKTEATCKACFVNSSTNDYKWATKAPNSSYTLDNTKTTESSCVASNVCWFNSSTKSYKWQAASPGSGYTISSTITTEGACGACFGNGTTIGASTKASWMKGPTSDMPNLLSGVTQANCLPSACYVNSSTNDYRWSTTSPGAGYTKSTTITSESSCVASNVCFKNSAGTEYKWQSAYPGSGWTTVPGRDEATCKACFVNNSTNDYKWAAKAPNSSYTLDSTKTTENACVASNVCFTNSTETEYKWQSAYPGSGWTIVSGRNEATCKACFVNSSTNDYKWATSSPGAGYTKSTTITSENSCIASDVCFTNSTETEYKWQSAYPGSGWKTVSNSKVNCNRIEIKKVDSKNGNTLSGATIKIDNGAEIEVGTYAKSGLSKGDHKIKETHAPNGYALDESEITITVDNDGEITISGGSNIYSKSNSKTRNATLSIKNDPEYCFIKRGHGEDNTYCYGTESHCSEFEEKINSSICDEEILCYLRVSDNTYVNGKYRDQEGFTKYGDKCPNIKCYINMTNEENEYIESITNPGDDWNEFYGICEEKPACYKNPNGKYVMGKYSLRDEYEFYADVCKIDVPITDLDINTIIYLALGVILISGIGLIAYSYSKKND